MSEMPLAEGAGSGMQGQSANLRASYCVLRDLSAAENDEREAYPPFSAIEQRHAEIREAFGRAQDGVPDPHPPPIEQPKL
jgi:hypothetical protein